MEDLKAKISNLICGLIPKVREQVPESGLFNDVYVEFENTDKELFLTHIMLKVEAVPKCIENSQIEGISPEWGINYLHHTNVLQLLKREQKKKYWNVLMMHH